MKKFLAVLFVLVFTVGEAFAFTEVRYNNAGARRSVAHGASAPRFSHNFGSNAAFTPEYRRYAGVRNRQIQREKAITQAIASSTASQAPTSRYSRNYTVQAPQRSYTRGGVTYYN